LIPNPTSDRLALPVVTLTMGLLILVILCFFGEFRVIFGQWRDSPFEAHGMLLAALVPVLIWLRRNDLGVTTGRRRHTFVACLLTLVAIAFFHSASVETAVWILLPCVAILAVAMAFGWQTASELGGPIGYFAFALPIWQRAGILFQWLTAHASAAILTLLHVPVMIRGELLEVPGGTFEIGALCSGTHFLVVAVALAVFLGLMDRLPLRRTAVLVMIAAAIAIVTNWIRVIVIIYVGNATRMHSPLVWDHYAFSWWLLCAGLLPFLWFAIRGQRHPPLAVQANSPLPSAVPGADFMSAVMALTACAAWIALIDNRTSAAPVSIELPPGASMGLEIVDADWHPIFPGAAAETLRSYRYGASTVTLYAAAYSRQERGRKLIGLNSSIAGPKWIEESHSTVPVRGAAGAAVDERVLADSDGSRRVVWFWYEVDGERFLSPALVKLREGLAAFGAGRRSGIVGLSAECQPDCIVARAALSDAYRTDLGRITIKGAANSNYAG
jgi:EpsI family protein